MLCLQVMLISRSRFHKTVFDISLHLFASFSIYSFHFIAALMYRQVSVI